MVSLLLLLPAWGADKAHTLRNEQIQKFGIEWSDGEKGINGFIVDFFDEHDHRIGGVTFFLPQPVPGPNGKPTGGLSVNSNRTIGPKELDGFSVSCVERPFDLGGPPASRLLKEFSADLKHGGTLHFWVKGKQSYMGQEWDLDVRGDLKIP